MPPPLMLKSPVTTTVAGPVNVIVLLLSVRLWNVYVPPESVRFYDA